MRGRRNVRLKGLLCLFLTLILLVGTLPGIALANNDTEAGVSGESATKSADSGDTTTNETEDSDNTDASATDITTEMDAGGETADSTDGAAGSDAETADTDAGTTETGLPEGWSPGGGARTSGTGTADDITSFTKFENGKLLTSSGLVSEGDGITFAYTTYTFFIDWSVNFTSLGTTLIDGDYFTFKVPADLFTSAVSCDIKNAQGVVMATLTIDKNGDGKVTFNSNVAGLTRISGNIGIGAEYKETVAGKTVKWEFGFNGETYIYEGMSAGYIVPTGTITDDVKKAGWQTSSKDYMGWNAYVNLQEEALEGDVTVKDTLGSDHKMTTMRYWDTMNYGYYGKTGYQSANGLGSDMSNYYFVISVIDWETMRDDYDKLIAWNVAEGNAHITYYTGVSDPCDTSGTKVVSKYATPATADPLLSGISQFMYGNMIDWTDNTGRFLYRSPYAGGLKSVEVEDGGYTIVFPDDELDMTSLLIRYYTQLTSPISPDKVENTIAVSGNNIDEEVKATATVTSKATISGTKGELLLYKYDTDGTTPLDKVSFTLTESGILYTSTESTDAKGVTKFTLISSGSSGYAGTYTLKENAALSGYTLMRDITLTLNSHGEVTAVNGTTISGGANITITDTNGERICQVSADQLALIVYNQEEPQPSPATVTLEGMKNLTGRTLTAGEFSFVLKDSAGTTVETVSNATDGSFNFSALTFSDTGTYTYTVEEVDGGLGGVTYDSAQYHVTVEVKYNGDNLETEVTYDDGDIVFNNIYSAADPSVTLTGTKNLSGKTLEADMFSFEVKDENGDTVATATNAADGTINFGAINYTVAGDYNYTVSEINGGAGGITYDDGEYGVTVTVTDNGMGQLVAAVTYNDGDIVFNNTYSVADPSVTLTGTKNLSGKTLEADMFSFVVTNADGKTVAAATNKADGTIVFSEIDFAAAGTYTYAVSEVKGSATGITYDDTSYTITVEATDNGDGTLTATVSYPDGGIVFNNTYKADTMTTTNTGKTSSGGTTKTSTSGSTGSSAKTGDDSVAWPWIVVLGASAIGIVGLVLVKKRKRFGDGK